MVKLISFLQALAPVFSAVSWPALLFLILVTQKGRLYSFADLLLKRLASDQKVEFGSLKLEAAVDKKLQEAQAGATPSTKDKQLTPEQISISRDVEKIVERAPESSSRAVISSRVEELSLEYEDLRRRLPRSRERTDRMNEVVVQLRALALAGRDLLPELRTSNSVGKRLAAIVFLQVHPRISYLQWLADRMSEEVQPFVIAQAALALLFLTREASGSAKKSIQEELKRALAQVRSFAAGPPDEDTIDILEQALRLAEKQ